MDQYAKQSANDPKKPRAQASGKLLKKFRDPLRAAGHGVTDAQPGVGMPVPTAPGGMPTTVTQRADGLMSDAVGGLGSFFSGAGKQIGNLVHAGQNFLKHADLGMAAMEKDGVYQKIGNTIGSALTGGMAPVNIGSTSAALPISQRAPSSPGNLPPKQGFSDETADMGFSSSQYDESAIPPAMRSGAPQQLAPQGLSQALAQEPQTPTLQNPNIVADAARNLAISQGQVKAQLAQGRRFGEVDNLIERARGRAGTFEGQPVRGGTVMRAGHLTTVPDESQITRYRPGTDIGLAGGAPDTHQASQGLLDAIQSERTPAGFITPNSQLQNQLQERGYALGGTNPDGTPNMLQAQLAARQNREGNQKLQDYLARRDERRASAREMQTARAQNRMFARSPQGRAQAAQQGMLAQAMARNPRLAIQMQQAQAENQLAQKRLGMDERVADSEIARNNAIAEGEGDVLARLLRASGDPLALDELSGGQLQGALAAALPGGQNQAAAAPDLIEQAATGQQLNDDDMDSLVTSAMASPEGLAELENRIGRGRLQEYMQSISDGTGIIGGALGALYGIGDMLGMTDRQYEQARQARLKALQQYFGSES